MRKLGFIIALIACVSGIGYAQITQEELDKAYDEMKEAKGNKKEKEATYQALMDEVLTQNAMLSIEEKDFVVEAERVTFKGGTWRHVTSTTNFVSVKDDQAIVQIAFDGAPPGPNGLGGVTVEGRITGYRSKTDKKGRTSISFNVNGIMASCRVDISIPKDSQKATVTVSPNLSSHRFTMNGLIWPSSQSKVFKGRSL